MNLTIPPPPARDCYDPRRETVSLFWGRIGGPRVRGRRGWVVEHGPRDRPMYLTGRAGWSLSAAKAIRFAREQDAQDFISEWLGDPQGLRTTKLAQSSTLGEKP